LTLQLLSRHGDLFLPETLKFLQRQDRLHCRVTAQRKDAETIRKLDISIQQFPDGSIFSKLRKLHIWPNRSRI